MNAPSLMLALLMFGATAGTEPAPSYEDAHAMEAPALVAPVPPPVDADAPHIIVIDQLARLYAPVHFDHDLHVSMSNMDGGCANCHHDLGTSTVAATCVSCHPAEGAGATLSRPSLKGAYHRQCLGCHRDWSHENGCGFCHKEITDEAPTHGAPDPTDIVGIPHPRLEASPRYVYQTNHTPAPLVTFQHIDHVESFGLKCVDCHSGATCATCHGPKTEPRIINRAANCFPCHAQDKCIFCHDVSPRGRFDHAARTGWSLSPGHGTIVCSACHTGERPLSADVSDGCRACHATSNGFDHAKIGVALVGSHAYFDCTECHRGSDAAADVSCTGCHDDRSYPAYLPGKGSGDARAEATSMGTQSRSCLPVRVASERPH